MKKTFVLDIGTSQSRFGCFSNDLMNSKVEPTIIATNTKESLSKTDFDSLKERQDKNLPFVYVGQKELKRMKKEIPCYTDRCVTYGKISNFEKFERLVERIISMDDVFKKSIDEIPLVLCESLVTSMEERLKVMEILLEKEEIGNLYIGLQPQFAILSNGLDFSSGLVIDIGFESTQITPIVDNKALYGATAVSLFGGKMISELLRYLLIQRGYEFEDMKNYDGVESDPEWSIEQQHSVGMKESMCHVFKHTSSQDYENNMYHSFHGSCEWEYELPDGSKVTCGTERVRSTEILFRKYVQGKDVPTFDWFGKSKWFAEGEYYGVGKGEYGLHKIILKSLSLCPKNKKISGDLLKRVVLSGGSTAFPGLRKRIENELKEKKELQKYEIKCLSNKHQPTLRNYNGACVFSQICETDWIVSRQDYEESGGMRLCFQKFDHYADITEEKTFLTDLNSRICWLREFGEVEYRICFKGGKITCSKTFLLL